MQRDNLQCPRGACPSNSRINHAGSVPKRRIQENRILCRARAAGCYFSLPHRTSQLEQVVHSVCAVALLLQAYRTAKQMKVHVDVVLDAVDDRYEERIISACGPAARRGVSRRRRATLTPAQATTLAASRDEGATRLLRFWVLTGLLCMLEAIGLPYAFSARVILTLAAVAPISQGTWIDAIYARTAQPLLGNYASRAIIVLRRGLRRVGATAVPFARSAAVVAVSPSALAVLSEADLVALRAAVHTASERVVAELRSRDRARLAWGLPARATHADGKAETVLTPLPRSDDEEDEDSDDDVSDGGSSDVVDGVAEPGAASVGPSRLRVMRAKAGDDGRDVRGRTMDASRGMGGDRRVPSPTHDVEEADWVGYLPALPKTAVRDARRRSAAIAVASPPAPPPPPLVRSASAPRRRGAA